MEKREQVFVSSTYLDLREEREKVIQGLLEGDCFPAGMEMFPASNDEKWDLIKGVIDDSDYYLLIIGGRYGAEDDVDDISYTEKEYDYAVNCGKPVMAFVHGEPDKIPQGKTDKSDEKATKLEAFREKVQGRMVKHWTNGDQLPGFVAQALFKIRKSYPAIGWVRGNNALTPQRELEVSELKRQVESLRAQLAAKQDHHVPIADLAEGEEKVELKLKIKATFGSDNGPTELQQGLWDVETTWDALLADLGPALLQESDEREIELHLERFVQRVFWDDDERPEDLQTLHWSELLAGEIGTVLVQFRALNYIRRGSQPRPPSDRGKYWVLTDEGADRLMQLRAIRKSRVEGPSDD